MIIKVKRLYDDLSFLSRKTRGGGFIDDSLFNSHLANVQAALFQRFWKVYENTQDITDHIKPFVVYDRLLESSTTGKVTFPSDYAHRVAVEGVYIGNPKDGEKRYECPILKSHEVASFLSDPIAKPDFAKRSFYHTFRNNLIQLFPERRFWIGFTYLRYPQEAKIVFTASEEGGQDVFTYDETNSVDLEWDDITYQDFIIEMCKKVGISTKDSTLIQLIGVNEQDRNA